MDWITTTVERRYEQTEPAPDKPPAAVSIRALDSGRYEAPLQMFGTEPLTNPRLDFEVQKYPAFRRKAESGSERFVILVNGRWLVDVTTQNLEPAELKQLLAALPLAQLAAAKESPANQLPSQVVLGYVDELNPQSDFERKEFFLTQAQKLAAEKEAAASRDEPFVDYYKNRERGEPKR